MEDNLNLGLNEINHFWAETDPDQLRTHLNISEGLVGQRKRSPFSWFLHEEEGEEDEERV